MVGVGTAGAVAGCVGDGGDDPEAGTGGDERTVPDEVSMGGTLDFITNEIPPSIDVQQRMGYGTAEQYIAYERLIKHDQDLSFEGRLATDWEIVDDRTYVFTLRDGVTFHDGSEFNAEVAEWNMERLMSDYSGSAAVFSPVDEVEATAENELTIHLEETFPPLLDALAADGYMVSRAALEDQENEWMQENPVGTGPFEFESWDQRDGLLEYTAYDDYWRTDDEGNELPYLDAWIFREIPEPQTQLQQFQSQDDPGNYLHGPSDEFVDDLMDDEDFQVSEVLATSNTINYLTMKTTMEPFDNPQVREAIYLGIDNEAVRQFVPHMQEINGPLPSHNWGASQNIQPEYDPEQAEQVLADAGFPDGLDVTLTIWSDDPQYEQVATVIQDQLGEIGVTVDIEVVETQALLEGLRTNEISFAGVHWGGGGFTDPYGNLHNLYHSEGQFNYIASYANEEVDDLLDDALSTIDRDERAALYQEAEELIFEDHPKVWFGRFGQFAAYHDNVFGVEPIGGTGFFTDDYANVWIDE